MLTNFYPPEGHDWIATSEIRSLDASNSIFAEANYSGEVAELKAKIISKFLGCNALIRESAWALFDIVPEEDTGGSVATDINPKDMLVWMGRVTDDIKIPPTLRMVTNETFALPNSSALVMTEDIIIDYAGDAQMLVDAFEIREAKVIKDIKRQRVLDGRVAAGPSYAPIFMLLPEGLLLENLEVFTPMLPVYKSSGDQHPVSPYGHFTFTADKLYALNAAQALFETIKDTSPKAYSCEG